jgi:ABC-type glycerol-3-phosphate transport system substrate-binding protein
MRNLTKNKVFLAIASLMFLALGCGGGSPSGGTASGQPISLKVWGTFETQDNMNFLIQAFQAKYPGVQISYTQKKVDTYESDLLNALASGNGPDVFAIHNDWLPAYQDKLVESPAKYMNLKDYKTSFVDVAVTDFTTKTFWAVPKLQRPQKHGNSLKTMLKE